MSHKTDQKNLNELLQDGGYENQQMSTTPSNFLGASKDVLRRVRALKKYQLESIGIESKFYQRVHELEKEFQPLFENVNTKRKAVILGEYEPGENECDVPLIYGLTAKQLQQMEADAAESAPSGAVGIPNFWYQCLSNSSQVSEMIQDCDVPVLKCLKDLTVEIHDQPAAGFTLLFHFGENAYFKNAVLSKYYRLEIGSSPSDNPFEYDGPTIVKCQGTTIEWKEGKNVTEKVVKKKQKKGPHAGRFVTKTVTSDSFFNFFNPAETEITGEDMDPELAEIVQNDFELGQIIRDQIIPHAVLYFTGEAADDDDEEDEEEDDDEMDDEDGEEDGNEDIATSDSD